MSRRHLALLIAILLGAGCSAPVAYYRCETLTGTPGVDPQAVWKCNREIVKRVVHGKKFSLREFRSAAEFFETLTGIPADTRTTRQGTQPGAEVRQNLEQWDGWYRDHRDSLVWDAESGTIRLAAGDSS